MTRPVVAYDFGRSNCRGALVLGRRRVRAASVDADATAVDAGGLEVVEKALRRLAARLDAPTVAGATLGLAGLTGASDDAAWLCDVLRELHGEVRTVVATDVTIAHAGALGGRPGIIVLAGTGAVTLGVAPTGEAAQVDGWGYLLGDVGSGFSIGRAGLAAALAQHDGRGMPTRLAELAEDRFGPLIDLPARVHTVANPPRLVATFADAVAEAARAGDEVAQRIWADAGHELARSVAAAVRRLRAAAPDGNDPAAPVSVSWAGGVFSHSDLLLDALHAGLVRLSPSPALVAPEGDAIDGAALLASNDGTCHEHLLLHKRGGSPHGTKHNNPPGRMALSQRRET